MSRSDGQRQLQVRARILQAAAVLMASEGFHGMSMRRLSKTAGTSSANVYNYFSSKEDILFAIQEEAFETLVATAGEALDDASGAVGRLYCFIYCHVRYFAENPQVMHVLVYEAASLPPERRRVIRGLKEHYFDIGRRLVRELVENGCGDSAAAGRRFENAAELERVTYSLFGMLNWIHAWYEPDCHGDFRQLARTIHEMAVCGMVANCPYRKVQERLEADLAAVEPRSLLGPSSSIAASVPVSEKTHGSLRP